MSGQSKNHTLKGGTSPYSLCMGVPPPPGLYSLCAISLLKLVISTCSSSAGLTTSSSTSSFHSPGIP